MRRRALVLAAAAWAGGCGGHPRSDHRPRSNVGAGISIAAPHGWHLLSARITGLVYPVDRLLLTSYPAKAGGNCGPDRAEHELPANGALAYLFEYRPRTGSAWPGDIRRADFPPRPAHFTLPRRALGSYECWHVPSYLIRFRAADRPFQLHVAFGARVGAARRAQLLRALDSLRIAAIAPPPPGPYRGWHSFFDEPGDTLRTPPGWLAAGVPSPRRQAQPRTLFVTANQALPGLPDRAGRSLRALPRGFPPRLIRGFPADGMLLWIREERPVRSPLPAAPRFSAASAPRASLRLEQAIVGGRGTRFSLRILSGGAATAGDRRLALRAAAAFGFSVGTFRNRPCRRVCESGRPVRVIAATPAAVSAHALEQALRTNPNDHAAARCRVATGADRAAARSFAHTARLFACRIAQRGAPPATYDVQLLANDCFVAERRRPGQADYGCVRG